MAWPLVPLSKLCRQHRTAASATDNLPYIAMDQVESNTGEIRLAAGSRSGAGDGTTFKFDARHVLYGKLRPYLNKVATPDFAGKCSTELVPLLPNDGVDRKFLAYVLRRDETIKTVMTAAIGARMPRASMDVLLAMPVPLPPLAEQQRIVDILDRAAAIQRLRRAAEDKAREIIPALFVDMFGDPATNPKGWPMGSVGEVLDRIETGKNVMAGSGRSSYRILKVSAVTSGVYDELESKPAPDGFEPDARSIVKARDFLFSRANTAELVGATTIVDITDGLTLLPDKLWRLVWKASVDTPYMLGVLQNSSIRAAISREASGTSASMRNVSQSKLLSVRFPLAPLEVQRVYGERFHAMTGAKALSLSASRFARSIQQAITNSLFPTA